MNRALLEQLLVSNGLDNHHDRAMFDIFIRMLLNYQMGLGISTTQVKKFMEITLTLVDMIGDHDE